MAEDCIFCKIIAGQIPSDIIYRDDKIIAFRDINPMAPVHLLIVPKKHIASLGEMKAPETTIVADMVKAAIKLARQENVSETGYRLVINTGPQGGQVVKHLHMHLLGGRQLAGGLG